PGSGSRSNLERSALKRSGMRGTVGTRIERGVRSKRGVAIVRIARREVAERRAGKKERTSKHCSLGPRQLPGPAPASQTKWRGCAPGSIQKRQESRRAEDDVTHSPLLAAAPRTTRPPRAARWSARSTSRGHRRRVVDREDLDVSPIVRRHDELVALLPAEQVAQAIGQAHLPFGTQGNGLGGERGLRGGRHGVNVSRFPAIARRRVESRPTDAERRALAQARRPLRRAPGSPHRRRPPPPASPAPPISAPRPPARPSRTGGAPLTTPSARGRSVASTEEGALILRRACRAGAAQAAGGSCPCKALSGEHARCNSNELGACRRLRPSTRGPA